MKIVQIHKGRLERGLILFKRIWLLADLSEWYFPICLRVSCVGNNNRIYNIRLNFLCFSLIVDVDEDSLYEGE